MRMVDEYRLIAFLARRQYGKTTTFAKIALKKMMKNRDHTIIFGSAKINLSREIVRAESFILQSAIAETLASVQNGALRVIDSETHKEPDQLTADDFAELFEAQRLEFRFYHSRTSYSRTKVVALRADTVGETGDLMCDEIGRVKNWDETWEAVSPIIASNPQFRCVLATTIPPDDSHYSVDQLIPPVGTEFKPSPDGNLYTSEMGIKVLRVDADDAYLDNVPLYDFTTGKPQTPAQSRAAESDKDSWDRNYGLRFIVGGTSACGLMQLATAQQRGIGKCAFFDVKSDSDLDDALAFLDTVLGPGKVGIGKDVATTTNQKSNPSSVAVVEQVGVEYIARLIVTWKTAEDDVATERTTRIVDAVAARNAGGAAKALAIDASNEKFFATSLRRHFIGHIPVELIVSSVVVEVPGHDSMNLKQYLGNLLTSTLSDNHLILPPEKYIKDDFRLVKKDRGTFTCKPDSQGRHADTFDAVKLALKALLNKGAFRYRPVETKTTRNLKSRLVSMS